MKKCFVALGVAICGLIILPLSVGAVSSNFQIQIFPVECSIDTLQTGSSSITQITPENCLDKPTPPGQPSEETLPGEQNKSRAKTQLTPRGDFLRVDDALIPSQLPDAFGYDSVTIQDLFANRQVDRSAEVTLYTVAIFLLIIAIAGYLATRLLIKGGFIPIIFHRFRRKKDLKKSK